MKSVFTWQEIGIEPPKCGGRNGLSPNQAAALDYVAFEKKIEAAQEDGRLPKAPDGHWWHMGLLGVELVVMDVSLK